AARSLALAGIKVQAVGAQALAGAPTPAAGGVDHRKLVEHGGEARVEPGEDAARLAEELATALEGAQRGTTARVGAEVPRAQAVAVHDATPRLGQATRQRGDVRLDALPIRLALARRVIEPLTLTEGVGDEVREPRVLGHAVAEREHLVVDGVQRVAVAQAS